MSAKIKNSFKLDSEPVLHWPKSPAKIVRQKGVWVKYSGKGMAYSLHAKRGGLVELVGWDPRQQIVGWQNIFSPSQSKLNGLLALARLHTDFSRKTVCEWVSEHGLLGLRPNPNSIEQCGFCIPVLVGDVPIHNYEPLECIWHAAQRASNVIALWSALKKSSAASRGADSEQAIGSIVNITENERDSEQYGSAPIRYRTYVNGEPRLRWPIPKSPRAWRELAYALLVEYIQEHIYGEIRVGVGIQEQHRSEEERNVESPPDWNLKPTWRIQSALAAYYVELLMVMRRFRSCKTCGKDISHQKANSRYCGSPSTCRSVDFHRRKAAKRKLLSVRP